MPHTLAEELRIFMLEKSWTQCQLARHIDTSEKNISRWLSGKYKISPAWRRLIIEKIRT